MRQSFILLFVTGFAIANVPCGGKNAPDSQQSPDAGIPICTTQQFPMPHAGCGGDLVGTWKLSCYTISPDPSESLTVAPFPEQTYTFDSTGHYTLTATGDPYYSVNRALSPSLNVDGGTPTVCAGLWNDQAALISGTCGFANNVCTCTYPTSGLNEASTYTTSRDTVTFAEGNASVRRSYCVSGTTLTLLVDFGNFGEPGVFTKQ